MPRLWQYQIIAEPLLPPASSTPLLSSWAPDADAPIVNWRLTPRQYLYDSLALYPRLTTPPSMAEWAYAIERPRFALPPRNYLYPALCWHTITPPPPVAGTLLALALLGVGR
jgi:hypothetical protein